MQNIGCHEHAFAPSAVPAPPSLENRNSIRLQRKILNIQIYDLSFIHYVQCVADKG